MSKRKKGRHFNYCSEVPSQDIVSEQRDKWELAKERVLIEKGGSDKIRVECKFEQFYNSPCSNPFQVKLLRKPQLSYFWVKFNSTKIVQRVQYPLFDKSWQVAAKNSQNIALGTSLVAWSETTHTGAMPSKYNVKTIQTESKNWPKELSFVFIGDM